MMDFVMLFYSFLNMLLLYLASSLPCHTLSFLLPSYPPPFSCLLFFFGVNFYPLSCYFLLPTHTI